MTRRSVIEDHPRRAQIETALACGMSTEALARKYGVHRTTLYRYKAKMPAQLKAALIAATTGGTVDLEKLRANESESLLGNLIHQRARLHRWLDLCSAAGDAVAAARFEAQMRSNLELTAKLVGELKAGMSVTQNVLVAHPEYVALRGTILTALEKFPKARQALLRELRPLETEVVEHDVIDSPPA